MLIVQVVKINQRLRYFYFFRLIDDEIKAMKQ